MKVAICFTGFLRSIEKTIGSLDRCLIQPNNCDVYVSTWDNFGHTSYKAGASDTDLPVTPNDLFRIFPKLTGYQIENCCERCDIIEQVITLAVARKPQHVAHDERHLDVVKRIMSQHYKIKRCIDLAGPDYDVVIRCRMDAFFKQVLHVYPTKPNTIVVPFINNYGYVNDQFAFGNPHAMQVYAGVYMEIPFYINEIACYAAENLLKHHLTINKILTVGQHIEYDFIR